MVAQLKNLDDAWDCLLQIPDPGLPTVNIVELGIVRSVEQTGNNLQVEITPTYFGCPSYHFIQREIERVLKECGFESVTIKERLNPPWTSSWLATSARRKLKSLGIAAPCGCQCVSNVNNMDSLKISCPFCESNDTVMKSEFGSSPCKAIYFCNSCVQPFEYFKFH